MLTQKQQDLFKLLEIPLEREDEIRKHHKFLRGTILKVKPFTGWLEDCLKAKWRKENERIYVGD
jgi:hypothetical protein